MNSKLALICLMACPAVVAHAQEASTEAMHDTLVHNTSALLGVVDNFDADDDEGGTSHQNITSTVVVQHDVFLRRAGFQLSQAYFRTRGYDNWHQQKYINGVAMNNQVRGLFNYASIGALNDVTRNGDVSNYTAPATFTFGALNGAENISMRAGDFARGGKATLSLANRNYYSRAMVTLSTGLMENGWAFTFSLGGRYGHRGNVEGTFYRNFSYAALLEKRWRNASLSLVSFGSPVSRGQSGSSMQEVYDLVDDNLYNANWGWQNGKRRNSRVVTAFDPTTILNFRWDINNKVRWENAIGFHYAYDSRTALNWYAGSDPRPDYYRYLPSYATSPELAEEIAEGWRRGDAFTQIEWDKLYSANYANRMAGNGEAIYMVESRRNDYYETSFNSTLNAMLSNNHRLTAGVGLRNTVQRSFKTVEDLLGADHVLDIDKYAEGDFSDDPTKMQNDLMRPNRKVFRNGIFGYNYNIVVNSANAWVVNRYNYRKWDGYYGLKYTHTSFQRDGKMQNGRFPDNSYGKGKRHEFNDLMVKGGLTYKLSGSHVFTANVLYGTEAPLPYNSYISPRINDKTSDLVSGRTFATDLSYIISVPGFRGRLTVYQTNQYDQMARTSYYHDALRTYVNHELRGLNSIRRGVELGATAKLDDHWSIDFAGTIGQAYYTNNPIGTISYENGKSEDVSERVYMRHLRLATGPQTAATLGLRYFINYWFLGANFNVYANNYVDPSPFRRLASTYSFIDGGNPTQMAAYHDWTTQERYPTECTVDLSVGKVFYLRGRKSINFNLAINNVLNNTNVRTGGYEQGRISTTNPHYFKSKYFYMQGTNAFLNVSYNF